MTYLKAVIFDLDGVLADSAHAHFVAWKRISDELGIAFSLSDNEAIKGVDRIGSLVHILEIGGINLKKQEIAALASKKNEYYRTQIALMGPDNLLPGAAQLIARARESGLPCAVASASRNAKRLLTQLGIIELFDYIADAGAIARPKPAPDIFLACSHALGVRPDQAIAFEDSAAGISAIRSAGMFAVGIGDPGILFEANIVYPSTAEIDLDALFPR
jgi:beta-phosphoglucomutase